MAVKNTTNDKPTGSDGLTSNLSLVMGVAGAIIPVFPFIFINGFTAVAISLILSLFGLFGIGAGVSLTSGSPLWKSGGRQVLLGLLAAGITFSLGKLIGSAIG